MPVLANISPISDVEFAFLLFLLCFRAVVWPLFRLRKICEISAIFYSSIKTPLARPQGFLFLFPFSSFQTLLLFHFPDIANVFRLFNAEDGYEELAGGN